MLSNAGSGSVHCKRWDPAVILLIVLLIVSDANAWTTPHPWNGSGIHHKDNPFFLSRIHQTCVSTQKWRSEIGRSWRVNSEPDRDGSERSVNADEKSNLASVIYNDFMPHPNPSVNALEVVQLCMETLLGRQPFSLYENSGLEVCFEFSSDRCRAANGGSLEKFIQYASNPVFGFLTDASSYSILSVGPIIPSTLNRGAMQTVLMEACQTRFTKTETPSPRATVEPSAAPSSSNGPTNQPERKRFLWTLQQERRPPLQGCWMIHEVIYVRNAINLTT
jgi:hypothetical protein